MIGSSALRIATLRDFRSGGDKVQGPDLIIECGRVVAALVRARRQHYAEPVARALPLRFSPRVHMGPKAVRHATLVFIGLAWIASAASAQTAEQALARLPSLESSVQAGAPVELIVPAPAETMLRSVLVAVIEPGKLTPGRALNVRVRRSDPKARTSLALTKDLHVGDPDVLWTIRQPQGTSLQITVTAPARPAGGAAVQAPERVSIRVAELGQPSAAPGGRGVDPSTFETVAFESEPNDSPETANPLLLGETVYGLADDRPYLPLASEPSEQERTAGVDWFTFTYEADKAALAFFALDHVDRDVPPDVRIYRKEGSKLVEYTRGIDPQSQDRERPPRPGANKFTTRVLERGTYYVWVDACHPEYQLRTKLFDLPPYLKPGDGAKAEPETVAAAARKAIRTAMNFQLLAGDSWHANTPRKGHPTDRVANFHHETSTCVACHPTHFTTQSVLAAVKAGYEIEQPFALQFLTERLANNPVPFHGHPQAVWARMIPAPANVLGRLSTMLMDYENLISGVPRDNLHRAIAEFLKLYYDGRTTLPPDESNGNNPVSRYKVAADSWRQLDLVFGRSGQNSYAETRDLVAKLLPTGTPAHTRDLAAQTIGLCLIDPNRERLGGLIDGNVQRLLSLQRDNGHWSVKFDADYPITEMQTGESLHALARAGLTADHAAVRRGLVALLGRQQSFGGWFDLNPYEQFRTPFRETQWALIALSSFYPSPNSRSPGWNGPLGRQPRSLRAESPATLIRDLERIWDPPDAELERAILAQLAHESPLVRLAACRALGRVGGQQAIASLARCLGEESKVVRRTSAEALRLVGNRLNACRRPSETPAQRELAAELARAIRSPDDRKRRGATRVFAAHFRDLSQDATLVEPLLECLSDPDPVVAMQAIKGLWRWWYWQGDLNVRNAIEDRLIGALAVPAHPWVRRNLIEALYIIGDDNIRYLYQNWVPALASADVRRAATAAQHATVNRLGGKYVVALEHGNQLQRDGVLRAMSEFFERPVRGGRIGNDLEPMLFYGEMVPRVASALIARLGDPEPEIRRLALQALTTVRGDREPELARAVAGRLGDPDPSVRTLAITMSQDFPLKISRGKPDPATASLINDLLAEPGADAQAAALAMLDKLGPVVAGESAIDPAAEVRARLSAASPVVRAAALTVLRSFPALLADAPVREAIEKAMADDDPQARAAAIRLALDPAAKITSSLLRRALDDPAPGPRTALLDKIAADPALRADLRLLGLVSDSLVDDHSGVRERALQLIQNQPSLVATAAIENSLRELAQSDAAAERQREIAKTLLASRGRSSADAAAARSQRLDRAYFQARVLPIFNRLGEDGQNCMGCHRSHTILKMVLPGKDGTWTPQAARDNYRAALRVVNLARPAESLLLGKPTWEAAEEAEAQNDPTKKAHAGGVRFEKGSREYQTLLDWINGARLPAGA
jgi:hypothetical protein